MPGFYSPNHLQLRLPHETEINFLVCWSHYHMASVKAVKLIVSLTQQASLEALCHREASWSTWANCWLTKRNLIVWSRSLDKLLFKKNFSPFAFVICFKNLLGKKRHHAFSNHESSDSFPIYCKLFNGILFPTD